MIWETLVGGFFEAVTSFLTAVFGLVPGVPSWLEGDSLDEVANSVGGVGQWLPIELALNVASSVVSAYLTAGMIGVSRSFTSSMTGGGGAS